MAQTGHKRTDKTHSMVKEAVTILTYQDLIAAGTAESDRMDFVLSAIAEHTQSDKYKLALDAEAYYHGENPTIMRYQKFVYDTMGRAHVNATAANHKIASAFLKNAIRQKCLYLLGNGISFNKPDTKQRLGSSFDRMAVIIAKAAKIEGICFGFWNLDHVERFKFTEFVPLYDEENGALKAGIRFWQLATEKPRRIMLFELDGYTDYIQNRRDSDNDVSILNPKRSYKLKIRRSKAEGERIYSYENYPSFPIVPLKNGTQAQSELKGRRGTIDALDLVSSGMVNDTDEGRILYWLVHNASGMTTEDDENLLLRIIRNHIVHTDGDQDISPHQVQVPVAASESALNMIYSRLYTDFSIPAPDAIISGSQTATAIRASYKPLDLDTDDFEGYVTEFIKGILALAGIDDEPTYQRNREINAGEEIQTLLQGAGIVSQAYIRREFLRIRGHIDQVEAVEKELLAEQAAAQQLAMAAQQAAAT